MKRVSFALCATFLVLLVGGCGEQTDKGSTTIKTEKIISRNQGAKATKKIVKTKLLSSSKSSQTRTKNSLKNLHIIDASTMIDWIEDWQNNRPKDVKGKLVVLQVGPAFANDKHHTYIKHDDKNIFTFDKAGGCSNTDPAFDRTDGVSVIPKAVLSGKMMDAAFMMYNIDPVNDMLLIVAGGDKKLKAKKENAAATARFAWSMKYWGLKHYAVLDGNIEYMLNPKTNPSIKQKGIESIDELFTEKASIPPMNGKHSIKEIDKMDQGVMATLEEMINVVKKCPNSAFIIDARSFDEYNANNSVKMSKTEAKICGENHKSQCYTAIEGHIKGAKNIEYSNFIVTDDQKADANGDGKVDGFDASFRFKTKAEIFDILKSKGYNPSKQVLYTYCRTGTRAALPAFIGLDILGVNTKLFDGSWIEWGRLAGKPGTKDVNGDLLLRCDSPWRTDTAELTEKLIYNPSNLVAPIIRENSPLEVDEYACSANKIKDDDCAYLHDK